MKNAACFGALEDLKAAMNDETNWESLFARFDYEKALSGYIANLYLSVKSTAH